MHQTRRNATAYDSDIVRIAVFAGGHGNIDDPVPFTDAENLPLNGWHFGGGLMTAENRHLYLGFKGVSATVPTLDFT